MRSSRSTGTLRLSILGLLAWTLLASSAAAQSEAALADRWQGSWVTLGLDTFSGCGGSFTNNQVRGGRSSSKGDHRFTAGELGTVYKIDLKRKQLQVLIELAEPILASRKDGPFTLHDELWCKVELLIDLPRASSRSTAALHGMIADLLERHEDRRAAEASDRWNRRVRDPYPADYDQTLYEHAIWQADLTNVEIAAKIDHALDEASRRIERLGNDPEYLAGLAEGVRRGRDHDIGDDCDRLLSRSIQSYLRKAPDDRKRSWRDGYDDGQKLVFNLEVARRLRRCFVPPPR